MKNNKLFIVPNNDGEAVEIQKLLQDNGYNYLVTQQQWGASWEGLEENIKKELQAFTGGIVYGVELQGGLDLVNIRLGLATYVNIDHHKYKDDDRSNDLSSLEQVANIIGVKLTEYQKAVACNDIHGVKGLKNKYKEHVDAVAVQDMLAQGITEEQIKIAKESAKEAERIGENLTIVKCQHSKTYPIKASINYNNILIFSDDGEINFEGEGQICLALQKEFEGWSGGNLPEYGFWGGYVNQEKVLEFVKKQVKGV